MKRLLLVLPLAFLSGCMRDKTFEGTWSSHKFLNNSPIEIKRSYDSFTEKGECKWFGGGNFVYPDAHLRRIYSKYHPYLSKSNSIVFPHGIGQTIGFKHIYGETYKVRLDNAAPLEIPNTATHKTSRTTVMTMKEWSQYKRIRIRASSTTTNDLDINTKKLMEAIKSYEKCKSFN